VLAGKGAVRGFRQIARRSGVTDPGEATPRIAKRIDHALWTEGQIALEFPPAAARESAGPRQRVGTGDPPGRSGRRDRTPGRPSKAARRTRPRRHHHAHEEPAHTPAARGAKRRPEQTFRDITWTIVNDGGDPEEVIAILRDAPIDPRSITLVSPRGKPRHGSRVERRHCGLRQRLHRDPRRRRQLVPRFPRKNGRLPRRPAGARYGGVTTHSTYVSEEIRGDRVIEHETRPYNDWVRNVQLSEMACGNFFPPIAFLFRRAVLDRDRRLQRGAAGSRRLVLQPRGSAGGRHRRPARSAGALSPPGPGRHDLCRLCEFGHRRRVETRGIRRHRAQRLSPTHGDRAGVAASFAMGYASATCATASARTRRPRPAPRYGP
jgi:hypothetical protein